MVPVTFFSSFSGFGGVVPVTACDACDRFGDAHQGTALATRNRLDDKFTPPPPCDKFGDGCL